MKRKKGKGRKRDKKELGHSIHYICNLLCVGTRQATEHAIGAVVGPSQVTIFAGDYYLNATSVGNEVAFLVVSRTGDSQLSNRDPLSPYRDPQTISFNFPFLDPMARLKKTDLIWTSIVHCAQASLVDDTNKPVDSHNMMG